MSSDMQINQMLAQMRALAAQAAPQADAANPTTAAGQVNFADLLQQSLNSVNAAQKEASSMAAAFERGEPNVELAEVMISIQKASLSFEAMKQVRNQLLKAYQDIMNMPV